MLEILTRISQGNGDEKDIQTLKELSENIKKSSLCGLGQTAPNPVLTTLRYFMDEYEAHINEKKCPAGVCRDLIEYKIDQEKCIGCTLCVKSCPVEAISGQRKEKHLINSDLCIRCGACKPKCPVKAIFVI